MTLVAQFLDPNVIAEEMGDSIAQWLNAKPASASKAAVVRILELFAKVSDGTAYPATTAKLETDGDTIKIVPVGNNTFRKWEERDRLYYGQTPEMSEEAVDALFELRRLLLRYRFAVWLDIPIYRPKAGEAWIINLSCAQPTRKRPDSESYKHKRDQMVLDLVLLARAGKLHPLRRCQQCGKWYYARRPKRKWRLCSNECERECQKFKEHRQQKMKKLRSDQKKREAAQDKAARERLSAPQRG